MSYSAEILSVGTELLLGNITNTDARDISQRLSELGINVFYHTVVGDNPERLKKAVEIAKTRSDIIITTGGLGPTCDDLTKQVLAEAFNKKLIFNQDEANGIKSYFKNRLGTCSMTENNLQQAMLPEGCTIFHNDWGTAPGCAFVADGTYVLMLPGPPRECNAMFKYRAIPYLKSLSDSQIFSHNIHIFGMGESAVEDKLHNMMMELENPTLAPYAKEGEVMLRVTAKGTGQSECEELMTPVIEKVSEILGDVIYGIDSISLENTVVSLLKDSAKTLAVAESCTGGLVSKRLTDIPGVSSVYLGGITAYANEIKVKFLGVDENVLETQGAVCEDVARQMAAGIRSRFGTDFGIGITGIAGPASDSSEKPVGTVYIALATDSGVFCRNPKTGTSRERIRTLSANTAFDMLRRFLTDLEVCP